MSRINSMDSQSPSLKPPGGGESGNNTALANNPTPLVNNANNPTTLVNNSSKLDNTLAQSASKLDNTPAQSAPSASKLDNMSAQSASKLDNTLAQSASKLDNMSAQSAPSTSKLDNMPAQSTSKANAAQTKRPYFAYTQGAFWGGPNTDYTTLAILACFPLTGFLGIDHAYLRSPLTAVIKIILNIFTLGLWYFFDVAQVLTEGDKIRKIGYSMPVFGPTGLGAGIFNQDGDSNNVNNASNNESNNKDNNKKENRNPSPLRFLVYVIAALIPLPFGQDFFAAGDITGGLAKLVTLFMPILWIFGLAWGIYIVFRLFFQTEALITEGVPRFFPWTLIMDDYYCSRGILGPGRECGEPVAATKGGLFQSIGQMLRGLPIIGRVVDPIMSTAETAAKTAQAVVEKSVQPSIQFATASVGAAKEILNTVPQVASNVANQAQAFTDPAKLRELAVQRGGGDTVHFSTNGHAPQKSVTPLIVLLVAGIASSGFLLAKLRSMVDFDLSKLSKVIKAPKVQGPTDLPPGKAL